MVKVLVCGDVRGNLDVLRSRVETLQSSKHGPFDVLFCVGDFTGDIRMNDLLSVDFPIPMYFICEEGHLLKDIDFGNNVHFLGGAGIKVLPGCGLKVAFLSGKSLSDNLLQSTIDVDWQYTKGDLEVLKTLTSKEGNQSIDILLTSGWPKGVSNLDIRKVDDESHSNDFAEMCKQLRPRYHFAGLENLFYQRNPFHNEGNGNFTRFIALAHVQITSDPNLKWLHALSLDPLASSGTSVPPASTTPSPFNVPVTSASLISMPSEVNSTSSGGVLTSEDIERITAQESANSGQFFFGRGGGGGKRYKRDTNRKNVAPRRDCWFCVASPACEKQLIVSISDDCYLSLPKGGVSAQHVQIIPIGHEDCFATLESSVLEQAIRYKEYIVQYFASFGCLALFFERNILLGKAMQRHAYLEAIPVPCSSASAIGPMIENEAKRLNLALGVPLEPVSPKTIPGISDEHHNDGLARLHQEITDSEEEYLYIEVSGNAFSPRVARSAVGENKLSIPLQFGRRIACRLLGCMNRVDWQSCIVPEEVEANMSDEFKKGFKTYDMFS